MSRHHIPTKAGVPPSIEVWAGWDAPMQTYFAQVIDESVEDDQDPVLVWVGGDPAGVNDPAKLAASIAKYADLTHEMQGILLADRRHGGETPTPLQRALLDLMRE